MSDQNAELRVELCCALHALIQNTGVSYATLKPINKRQSKQASGLRGVSPRET